jgi:lipopolysaccharide transport system ATP-binding protein
MSSETVAISIRGLGKKYSIAHNVRNSTTLREAVINRLRQPLGRNKSRQETFWALRDVNLDIRAGEVVGIIGRNGAGKSTLLKLLSRITGPTAGSIDMHGRPASLLEVGTGFHPELTGRENIFLNGSLLGMRHRDIKQKFDEIVAFSEIEKFLDTPVKRYSSGMYVRLAFAVAAHLDPEILILDEVLAVGDSEFQRKCLAKVRGVATSGDRIVLFVSHNLTSVRSLCDRVIWMKEGRIFRDGAVGRAIEEYLTEDLGTMANSFDLDQVQRTYVHDTPVRIMNVTFNGGGPIRHGEHLLVEIRYRCYRTSEGVAFGLSFANQEGARVMNIDSDIPSGDRFELPAHQEGCVALSVAENLLQPSRYFVGVAARSGDNHGLDHLPMFAQVEVLEGPTTPVIVIARGEAGCVRMPSTYAHSYNSLFADYDDNSPRVESIARG